MASDILHPRNNWNIASDIESEVRNLKIGLGLMGEALQFQFGDAEQAGLAQDQLFFLLSSFEGIQKRMVDLSRRVYEIDKTEIEEV